MKKLKQKEKFISCRFTLFLSFLLFFFPSIFLFFYTTVRKVASPFSQYGSSFPWSPPLRGTLAGVVCAGHVQVSLVVAAAPRLPPGGALMSLIRREGRRLRRHWQHFFLLLLICLFPVTFLRRCLFWRVLWTWSLVRLEWGPTGMNTFLPLSLLVFTSCLLSLCFATKLRLAFCGKIATESGWGAFVCTHI